MLFCMPEGSGRSFCRGGDKYVSVGMHAALAAHQYLGLHGCQPRFAQPETSCIRDADAAREHQAYPSS